MKIIQSFWSGNQTELNNFYGWYSSKHNWLSWILSCNQLVKYHKEVELYTDNFGYEILIKRLKLPYSKVHVILDELNDYDKNLWAIAKVRTFQLQNEAFLHVDGDVFVWESLTEKFKKSNLVTQNLEITTKYYRDNWDIIYPQLSFLPNEMEDYHNENSNLACNMGIIGGNNIEFFNLFTEKSIEFVSKNKFNFKDTNALNFNVFFEQVLFYEMAKVSNEKIDFLIDEISLDNNYQGFGEFDKVPQKKYLHLLGVYKRDSSVCKAMEVYIMKYYPESYSVLMKIINEDRKNTTEITFLNKNEVDKLIKGFEAELKNDIVKVDNFLLKRDLFGQDLPLKLDELLQSNINFIIVKLNCFNFKTETIADFEIKYIEIQEQNHVNRKYDLDEIDEIILFELNKSVDYNTFIRRIKEYIDEEEKDTLNEFLFLVNQRLRNYLILRIIAIYN